MKKFGLQSFLLLVIIFSVNCFAQTEAEVAIQRGNTHYQNEDYSGAIDAYNSVIELGYESAALHYNIGNSYFRLGNIGRAILNYEKALKIDPNDEDVIYNLKIAEARTVDKIKSVPKLFIIEWWEILLAGFSVSGWSTLFIFLYLIFLTLIAFYFMSKSAQIQKLSFYLGTINLGVIFIVIILFVSSYSKETNSTYGILLDESISAKQSPNIESTDAFLIHEGVKFEIEEKFNNWAKIKLADGKVGWLPQSSFEGI